MQQATGEEIETSDVNDLFRLRSYPDEAGSDRLAGLKDGRPRTDQPFLYVLLCSAGWRLGLAPGSAHIPLPGAAGRDAWHRWLGAGRRAEREPGKPSWRVARRMHKSGFPAGGVKIMKRLLVGVAAAVALAVGVPGVAVAGPGWAIQPVPMPSNAAHA